MTILEAARTLQTTKNTIKYRLKKAPPEATYRAADGKIIITEKGFKWLQEQAEAKNHTEPVKTTEELYKTDLEPDKPVYKPGKEPPEVVYKPGEPGKEPQQEPLALALEALREQLRTKDRQIEQLAAALESEQKHAENLTAALASTQKQLDTAQALHAGSIQQGLIGSADQEKQPEPKGFWQRIMHK